MKRSRHLMWVFLTAAGFLGCSSGSSERTVSGNGPVTKPVDDDAGNMAPPVRQDAGATTDPGNTEMKDCQLTGPDEDADVDGFTPNQGDCNDCSPEINPGAFDFPGNEFDEDCDGTMAAMGEGACDMGLAINASDPKDAARALGLCKFTTADKKDWGVIEARYTTADGSGSLENPLMVGALPKFGAAAPRQGAAVLALSSGVARAPGQDGYTKGCDQFNTKCTLFGGCSGGATPPEGYPKESSACEGGAGGIIGSLFPTDTKVYNQAALELKIRVPTNANSFSFDSIFYTYEYPSFICSQFNDFFVVFKEPKPENIDDGNIVFDSNKDPIGVNTGLLAVCNPADQVQGSAKTFDCNQGTALLTDTGYGVGEATCAQEGMTPDTAGGASTGWLNTTAPVSRGEIITVRFAIWDTNDATLDSTAVVDNFAWSVKQPEVTTTPILQ